ncbi:hypothetical protein P389DRAFT_193319 [Cystobasidium minutum MCA 4210]|uniref:uncharacterized protein n=1 Tax=Cystobasidium minutum MCA 4210 TaxID=1397322 RepID=UPI0034CEC0A6|eukprot:jgi/Rhomi1/193319/gm1.1533_g
MHHIAVLDSYLPTHPASLIPGLPQLAWLLGWLFILAILWTLARLLLSVLFTRFLHAHLSIGRIGWLSLNDIEWSLVRHAKGTTSAKVQKITIQRISLTLRGRGAKDNDIRLAWLGLTVKGLTVTMCLVPSRDTAENDPGSTSSSPESSESPAHESLPPPSSRPFSTTPSFASLGFADKGSASSSSKAQQRSSTVRQVAQYIYYSIRTVHDIRRRIRHLILRCIPEGKRRTFIRRYNLATRTFRHRVVAPALRQINSFGRSCNVITVFLALEFTDITIDIPQIKTQLKIGLVRVGGELVRRTGSYVGFWARLEQLALVASDITSESSPPSKRQSALAGRAFEMPGPLLLEAQANFDPEIGMAALYHRDETGAWEPRKTILDLSFAFLQSSNRFGKDEKIISTSGTAASGSGLPWTIKVRLNCLLEVIERTKNTIDPHPHPHFGPNMLPHLHARELSDDHSRSSTPRSRTDSDAPAFEHNHRSHLFDSFSKEPTIPARRNPAAMLRSIFILIPLIKIEAKLPEFGEKPRTPIAAPQQIHTEIRLRGLHMEAAVAKMLTQEDKHLHWFGKDKPVKLAAKGTFEKFDIDVAPVITGTGALDSSVRVLEVSPASLNISSSWLPPRADALFRDPPRQLEPFDKLGASTWGGSVEPTSPGGRKECSLQSEDDDSDERSSGLAVLEADIGGVNGEASLEVVQGLLLILSAHQAKRAAIKQALEENSVQNSEDEIISNPWQAYSPPTVALVVECGRTGYRIVGPKAPHRAVFGPGEDDAELSPGFAAPSVLYLNVISLAFTLQTRYADIPLHRTEAQRRELKQEIKRGSIFVPNVLFRGSQSQRNSEARAKEARQRMFDSPRLDEDQEEWSPSLSPTTPIENPGTAPSFSYVDADKSQAGVPLTSSAYRENDFLCFITPDDGHMPEYARRIAASHGGGQKEVAEHPFVYFFNASVTCQKIDIYLISSFESPTRDTRSNPTSTSSTTMKTGSSPSTAPRSQLSTSQTRGHSHARRHSRPLLTKRHDILTLDWLELAADLEVMGREFPSSEDAVGETPFLSLVNSEDTHGTCSVVFDGVRAAAANVDVLHCLSAVLHLRKQQPTEGPSEDTGTPEDGAAISQVYTTRNRSASADSDHTSNPPTPLAKLLPANINFSVAFLAVEILVAGPDPKFMPDTCRGLGVKITQLTLQRYRQDRYVVNQTHAHIRAPLGLPPDLRAHAQGAFNPHKEEAYVSLHLRGLRINPFVESGGIVRAKPPINAQGRSTTDDVEIEPLQTSKWCNLPRDHFFKGIDDYTVPEPPPFPDKHHHWKSRKGAARTNAARVRDSLLVETIEVYVTFWTRRPDPTSDSQTESANSLINNRPAASNGLVLHDHVGLVVRVPAVIARIEAFQVYCALLAMSSVRSLGSVKPTSTPKPSRRTKPRLQIKCNIPMVHAYCTLPHNVKLYLNLRRMDVSLRNGDLQLEIDSGILAGESHVCKGLWEDIIKFRKWTFIFKTDNDNAVASTRSVTLKGDAARLRIPCKYPFSEIVDNLVTFMKVSKQLASQFVAGKYTSAIEPHAEGPKHVPEIRIVMGILVLEAADDPFEAKLNLIWRAGMGQQAHRLKQDEVLEDRLKVEREKEALARADQARVPIHTSSDPDHGRESMSIMHEAESVAPQVSPHPKVSPARLRNRLRREHSKRWVKVFKDALDSRLRDEDAHLKRLYGHTTSHDDSLPIQLLSHHGNTPLMRIVLGKVDLQLSRPHFDMENAGLAKYLYTVGKGVPEDTKYSLLIPLHLDWRMNEAKVHVRDYPIPLLEIPHFVDDSKSSDEDVSSWHLDTDFVIAEELADSDSIRRVSAVVVPPEASGHRERSKGYWCTVPRTAMPVKFYALPNVTIKSDLATRLCWGNSIQPAIQDVMRVLDSLTKPPPDPSERLGFWDKIRLILHVQIDIKFEGKGPLHLVLKGSRDPYQVDGIGAGFSLSWHNDVRWKIGFENPDREFFQILSDRFVLGVPDLSDYEKKAQSGEMHERPKSNDWPRDQAPLPAKQSGHDGKEQKLLKVCAKFQGGVRWGLGMRFERTCRPETCQKGCEGTLFRRKCRIFDFRPHYEVRTISGKDAVFKLNRRDSYWGFRSDFIHFSVSVVANRPNSPANTLHLTPNGFDHFWAWWHLFDGTLSLPIRHGAVFESSLPPSKKFGKHCATIKYRIQLAPVYIAHTYRQENVHDLQKGFATVLGLKGRLESFDVDMHQREQETKTKQAHTGTTKVRLHKAFHRVEVDCKDTELRVVSARFGSTAVGVADSESENPEFIDYLDMDTASVVAEEDAEWVDDDDYLDLYTPLGDRQPSMHLLACMKTPRLTYSRYAQHDHLHTPLRKNSTSSPPSSGGSQDQATQTDAENTINGPVSKFGYEGTHTCLLDRARDALDVQLEVMQSRVAELENELKSRSSSVPKDTAVLRDLETRLRAANMAVLRFRAYRDRKAATSSPSGSPAEAAQGSKSRTEHSEELFEREYIPEFHVFQDLDTWINRLMIHNPNVVISQRIRDIILRYYYSSRERKLFGYAMTAKAIKFIKDMARQYRGRAKSTHQDFGKGGEQRTESGTPSWHTSQEPGVSDLLDSLIREATEPRRNKIFDTQSPTIKIGPSHTTSQGGSDESDGDPMTLLREQLAANERSRNGFLVSILKPQVCLFSEMGGQSSTVVIASQALQVRVCAIIDIDYVDDPINATVMHRSFGRIDALQVFYPHLRGWRSGGKENLLSHANAFVPLELLSGLAGNAKDLDTIVAPTNAILSYDKNNRLRLVSRPKKDSDSHSEGCDRTVDRFSVTCDRFTVNATSTHFAAIYDVIANLILYTDPSQKDRSLQIEGLVLSGDFSDTANIARNLEKHQNELRKRKRAYRQLLEKGRGPKGSELWYQRDLTDRSVELTRHRDEVTLLLAALQRSQASRTSNRSTGLRLDARAQEIVWHMREGDGKPLAKVAVNGAYFCWQNRSDGGVSNSLVIRDLNALNSGVDPYFPEIISKHPYSQAVLETRFMKADIFVAVIWSTLGSVGGIDIIDHFQVHLHPIKLQMEQRMADKMKHYFFAERDKHNSDTASIASGGSSLSSRTPSASSVSLVDSHSGRSSRLQLGLGNRSTDSFGSAAHSSSNLASHVGHGNSLRIPSSASSQISVGSGQTPSSIKDKKFEPSLNRVVLKDAFLDADEMRHRARVNHTFLHVELFPTVLCLSFKGDKHTTLPDVYGLIYKSPTIIHCNRIWTYEDLLDHIKKDFTSSIWSQSATLLGQLLTTARKPKNAVQQHVQQRLLGHVSDKPGERDRRRSLTSSFRARLSSAGGEDTKVSPLRSSYVRQSEHDDDSSDSDASDTLQRSRS